MTLVISRGITLRKGYIGTDDPDAEAYIAAVEAADEAESPGVGALETATKVAIHSFVKGCKNDGIWPAIKASCILAGARTLTGALVPLVGAAPSQVGTAGGWNYVRKTGLAGNGTDNYLNSHRNNNADPQDSQHLAVQITTLASTGSIGYMGAGRTFDNGATRINTSSASNTTLVSRSRTSTGSVQAVNSLSIGLAGISRSTSVGYIARGNNTNYSITQASQTSYNGNVFVFHISGTTDYSNARLAFYSIGESLDLALLDARVTDLINAFGAAIP
jgi:hypothetical protein